MSSVVTTVLDNGVTVVCEPIEYVESVAVGIWCSTGSRMESESEGGISHLIEHMMFKGTEKRTAEEIAQSIEGRGGHMNAFTGREVTCYHARVLATELENAVDVLSDMYVHSLFDAQELEKEKTVVQEEIKKHEDSPEDHVHDLHTQNRWGAHPLGRPIIGTHESVGSFDSEACKDYLARHYTGSNTIVAAAGKVDPARLRRHVEDGLGNLAEGDDTVELSQPSASSESKYHQQDTEQVHFCIGGEGVSATDEGRFAMRVLDAVLGGSMSSRLFQRIREQRGLVYSIGSYLSQYRDAGGFTVYGGTSKQNFEEVESLVDTELRAVIDEELSAAELERVKVMLKGNLLMALESMSRRVDRIAHNEIYHGRQIPIEETVAAIDAVSAGDIRQLAAQFLNPDELSTTAIGP